MIEDPPAWVTDAVFYQIFVDRFASSERVANPGPLEPWDEPPTRYGFKGGDLLGIVEQLDYLEALGINALYLTPIFASAANHRYHTYDYYTVDPLLGGDAALRELLDACHARGMRVILDGVFNHSGRGFWPFHHVVENGLQSPYIDWFHVDREALAAGRPLRPYPSAEEIPWLSGDAPAGERQGELTLRQLGYRAWWDLPALPKLNTDNPNMREHLLGAAEHWLRFGIDGWRLDVAEEIDGGFWREFRQRARAVNPDAYIVAEIWREQPQWLTGDTFDGLMNYPLAEALLSFTAARRLDLELLATQHEYRATVRPIDGPEFAARLEHLVTMYRPPAIDALLNLLGSHDTARFVTLAGGDVPSLRLAFLALMTLPGAPCIYYGDEIGIEGRQDPDSRRAFPWDRSLWNVELLEMTRALIALRHAHPALRRGSYVTLAAQGDAIVYSRVGADTVVVALNSGDEAVEIEINADALPEAEPQQVNLPGQAAARWQRGGSDQVTIAVAGRSGAIFIAGDPR